jgi:hypothetical protein
LVTDGDSSAVVATREIRLIEDLHGRPVVPMAIRAAPERVVLDVSVIAAATGHAGGVGRGRD